MTPDGYAELEALAERRRELAAAGRFAELAETDAQWRAIAAALPERPPASARPALERSAAIAAEVTATLRAACAIAAEELRRVQRTRAVRGAYSGRGAGRPAPRLLDRSG